MPNLIKYMGYVDDGVDEFLCLNCKDSINIRNASFYPIIYCPYCGIKFEGGFIKDSRKEKSKYIYKLQEKEFEYRWKVEFHQLNIDRNGNEYEEIHWGDETLFCSDKKQLLDAKREREKSFTGFFNTEGKILFETRLVYYKEFKWKYGKDREVILKVLPAKYFIKFYDTKKKVR